MKLPKPNNMLDWLAWGILGSVGLGFLACVGFMLWDCPSSRIALIAWAVVIWASWRILGRL